VVIAAAIILASILVSSSFQTTVTETQTTTFTTTLTTSSSSTCSGYPPAGDCIGPFNVTFTLSVNYSGPWKLSYQGCTGIAVNCGFTGDFVIGNITGTGFYSRPITLTGLSNNGLSLCAQAQKLDASSATLILKVTGYNETSAPYGSASYCGGAVP